jgi:prepilin-type processing-associated H-X9-DG protein
MSNHRQLCIAWRMYIEDNNDTLLFASESDAASYPYTWVTGTLNMDPNNRSNWDPDKDITKSPMWPYCGKSLGIWKCPGDKSFVRVNGVNRPRVRSMSMNVFLGGWGGGNGGWSELDAYKIYLKYTEINDPGPSKTFVFLDMREDSIDMGNFAVDMKGSPKAAGAAPSPMEYGFWDLPGFYHNNGCGFSFADGHSDMKRWIDGRTMPKLRPGVDLGSGDRMASPNNKDVAFLQDVATRAKQ